MHLIFLHLVAKTGIFIVWMLEDIQGMPCVSFDPDKEILRSIGRVHPYAYNGQTEHSHRLLSLEHLQDII